MPLKCGVRDVSRPARRVHIRGIEHNAVDLAVTVWQLATVNASLNVCRSQLIAPRWDISPENASPISNIRHRAPRLHVKLQDFFEYGVIGVDVGAQNEIIRRASMFDDAIGLALPNAVSVGFEIQLDCLTHFVFLAFAAIALQNLASSQSHHFQYRITVSLSRFFFIVAPQFNRQDSKVSKRKEQTFTFSAKVYTLPTNRELFRAALARGWTPADLRDAYKLARDFNSKITLREVLADAVDGALNFPPPCDGQSLS
jgi:hypothetical protein